MDIRLLLIDPQEDFCNKDWGSLYVPGADLDMIRVATMVQRLNKKINRIHTTLDQHHSMAIFHPMFWVNSNGKNPDPFTLISVDDVKNGTWKTTHPSLQSYGSEYVQTLEANNRYVLCVWPPHCLIGTPGSNVVPEVSKAFIDWERDNFKMVEFVSKGSNFKTEHYSAVRAEVPDPTDPTTNLNTPFINTLEEADIILTGGEALTHCWMNTIRDIVSEFDESNIKKFIFLEDASSSVPGFEKEGEEFVHEMIGKGMQVSTTDKVLINLKLIV